MSTKPTIVLIPGAWHTPAHFAPLLQALDTKAHPTRSIQLPSVDCADPANSSAATDAQAIIDTLTTLLNDGKDLVLIAHSYGGIPAGAAANGLSKAERAAVGKPGGIIGLIWIAAMIAPENVSLLQLVGGKFAPWMQVDNPSEGYCFPSTPLEVFYADVPEALAATAVVDLKRMSTRAQSTGAGAPGWANPGFKGRLAYVRCESDRAIPNFAQDGMVKGSGVEWEVRSFETSHSPFLSQAEELAGTIDALVKKWAS